MPRPVEVQLRKTYFSLRVGVALIGILLPFILWIGGKSYGIPLRPSMSAYYYATVQYPDPPDCRTSDVATAVHPAGSMRNWFVGFLFAVGAMLFVNKGSTDRENVALTLAGLFAVGVAVFPMAWDCSAQSKFSIHGSCAFLFFAAIAFVCAFCADETLQYLNDPKKQTFFRNLYRVLAVAMISSPITAWIFNEVTYQKSRVFYVETFGILSFGVFWLAKSREIALITKERGMSGRPLDAVPV